MLPWFDRPVIFDVRARPSLIQSQSGSRDLQMVSSLPNIAALAVEFCLVLLRFREFPEERTCRWCVLYVCGGGRDGMG
jgi:hypothetical protein